MHLFLHAFTNYIYVHLLFSLFNFLSLISLSFHYALYPTLSFSFPLSNSLHLFLSPTLSLFILILIMFLLLACFPLFLSLFLLNLIFTLPLCVSLFVPLVISLFLCIFHSYLFVSLNLPYLFFNLYSPTKNVSFLSVVFFFYSVHTVHLSIYTNGVWLSSLLWNPQQIRIGILM